MENRVLIIQEAGRHEKNKEYRESLSIMRALKSLGVECMVWGKGYPTYKIPFEQIIKGYNVLFVVENYDFEWIPDLSKFNGIKVFWSIDGHMVLDKHKEFVRTKGIQIVLNSVYECTPMWDGMKVESLWLPNAVDSDLVNINPILKKKHFIGFCGSKQPERDALLDFVDEDFKKSSSQISIKRDYDVIGEDMVSAINEYGIHLNRNIKNDINYRTFETLACGTCLLTNVTSGIELLFEIDKHLIVYNSQEQILPIVLELHYDRNKLKAITENGYKHVMAMHTYKVRMKHLLEYFKTL